MTTFIVCFTTEIIIPTMSYGDRWWIVRFLPYLLQHGPLIGTMKGLSDGLTQVKEICPSVHTNYHFPCLFINVRKLGRNCWLFQFWRKLHQLLWNMKVSVRPCFLCFQFYDNVIMTNVENFFMNNREPWIVQYPLSYGRYLILIAFNCCGTFMNWCKVLKDGVVERPITNTQAIWVLSVHYFTNAINT